MLIEALGFGLVAQSSLFLAGLAVCWITVPTKVVGILAGFGAGAMIAAIAFELVPEGQADIPGWEFALWTLVGVTIFLVGDWLVERRFGSEGAGGSIGIVVDSGTPSTTEPTTIHNANQTAATKATRFIANSPRPK